MVRIACRTFGSRSAGIFSMLCAVRACSRIFRITSSSLSPRTCQSHGTPTSLQVYVFVIGSLLSDAAYSAGHAGTQAQPNRRLS